MPRVTRKVPTSGSSVIPRIQELLGQFLCKMEYLRYEIFQRNRKREISGYPRLVWKMNMEDQLLS